jgi:gamma-glutamylcyclotransferase (GGCT)/AIG2-like uncharacterized protein YtfP
MMQRIDRLEGHPHSYKREKTNIKMQDGQVVEAWLYFYPEIPLPSIWVGNGLYRGYQ